jgi:cytochrome c556
MKRTFAAVFCLATIAMGLSTTVAPISPNEAPALDLSDHVRGILKHEMAALVEEARAIEKALAAGDHTLVAKHAKQMDKAFIFSEQITTLDLRELEAVLGEDFVSQDKAFHALARTLRGAAKLRQAEVQRAVFDKMLQACAACHQTYAPEAPVLE